MSTGQFRRSREQSPRALESASRATPHDTSANSTWNGTPISIASLPVAMNSSVWAAAWKAAQEGLIRAAEDAQGLGVPFRVYFAEVS